MYTGFKPPATNISKSNISGLNQTQIQSLQKQVDNYTRKLQQQKRKYFAIQDQHKSITQQYTNQKTKLNELKKQTIRPQTQILQSKIKNLQSNLDKSISQYDDTVAYNNKLKHQIDMLRRQKKNFIQMQKSLQQQMKKLENQTIQKVDLINKKKKKTQDIKLEIEQMKNKNQQERQIYLNKFSNLEKQYIQDHSQMNNDLSASHTNQNNDFLSSSQTKSKPTQIIDTQPLLKFRLKRLITSNKQKLKMIQSYKKHMQSIQTAFNQIKQKSNITDLQEITNMFIRSEEQNYSLYNYMDQLSQGIQKIDEENRMLEEKIKMKIIQDQDKKEKLINQENTANQKQKQRERILNHANINTNMTQSKLHTYENDNKMKQKQSQDLIRLVQTIKPTLQSTLLQLSSSPLGPTLNPSPSNSPQTYQIHLNLTDRNINQYLSDLQRHINSILFIKQQAHTSVISQLKQTVTTYTKPVPNSVNFEQFTQNYDKKYQKNNGNNMGKYDKNQKNQKDKYGNLNGNNSNTTNQKQKQKQQNKFLQENKLRQYAIQFWQKRKTTNNNSLGPNQKLPLGQYQKQKINLMLNNRQAMPISSNLNNPSLQNNIKPQNIANSHHSNNKQKMNKQITINKQ